MSATKRDSPTGVGTIRDFGYEEWSDDLPLITDDDIELMATQDENYQPEQFA